MLGLQTKFVTFAKWNCNPIHILNIYTKKQEHITHQWPQASSSATKGPRLRTAKPELEASSDDRLSWNLRGREE